MHTGNRRQREPDAGTNLIMGVPINTDYVAFTRVGTLGAYWWDDRCLQRGLLYPRSPGSVHRDSKIGSCTLQLYSY